MVTPIKGKAWAIDDLLFASKDTSTAHLFMGFQPCEDMEGLKFKKKEKRSKGHEGTGFSWRKVRTLNSLPSSKARLRVRKTEWLSHYYLLTNSEIFHRTGSLGLPPSLTQAPTGTLHESLPLLLQRLTYQPWEWTSAHWESGAEEAMPPTTPYLHLKLFYHGVLPCNALRMTESSHWSDENYSCDIRTILVWRWSPQSNQR